MAIRLKPRPDLMYETKYWNQGKQMVVGMDEVGRGCLSGPVVVAAVVFNQSHQLNPDIRDSKQLSINQRNVLCEWIYQQAESVSAALVPVSIIDEINILEATKLAMAQALLQFDTVDQVLVDGRDQPTGIDVSIETIIKGDQVCYSIAAASIVAKVIRDTIMTELHQDFPQYGWQQNKGYGTKLHRQAILTCGPTPHHRKLFLRKILLEFESQV